MQDVPAMLLHKHTTALRAQCSFTYRAQIMRGRMDLWDLGTLNSWDLGTLNTCPEWSLSTTVVVKHHQDPEFLNDADMTSGVSVEYFSNCCLQT